MSTDCTTMSLHAHLQPHTRHTLCGHATGKGPSSNPGDKIRMTHGYLNYAFSDGKHRHAGMLGPMARTPHAMDTGSQCLHMCDQWSGQTVILFAQKDSALTRLRPVLTNTVSLNTIHAYDNKVCANTHKTHVVTTGLSDRTRRTTPQTQNGSRAVLAHVHLQYVSHC